MKKKKSRRRRKKPPPRPAPPGRLPRPRTGAPAAFFCSSRRRHTRYWLDWSSDVCSSDLLTRLGFNSKMVVTGDITQIDLEKNQRSGLVVIGDILEGVEGIDFVRFGGEDVVR